GRVGLWMELVRGTTLEDLLQRQGTFSGPEASFVGRDMCGAVAAVHRAGLLHGDIKAHNVMREEGGRNVLMDFGAGKDLDMDFLHAYVGGADDFAGTPLYLAPEVFTGSRRTQATDIYSLGVLLFHLVTNRYPVEGDTRAAVEDAHRRARARSRSAPAVPDCGGIRKRARAVPWRRSGEARRERRRRTAALADHRGSRTCGGHLGWDAGLLAGHTRRREDGGTQAGGDSGAHRAGRRNGVHDRCRPLSNLRNRRGQARSGRSRHTGRPTGAPDPGFETDSHLCRQRGRQGRVVSPVSTPRPGNREPDPRRPRRPPARGRRLDAAVLEGDERRRSRALPDLRHAGAAARL